MREQGFHQRLISSFFCKQILKAQKDSQVTSVFLPFWEFANTFKLCFQCAFTACGQVFKVITLVRANAISCCKCALKTQIATQLYPQLLCSQIQKHKKDNGDLTVFLCFWDLHVQIFRENVGKIDPNSPSGLRP